MQNINITLFTYYTYMYDWIGRNYDGKTVVMKGDKWGAIDLSGNIIIPLEYDYIFDFEGDFAIVELNGVYGIINENNDVAVTIEYDEIECMENGRYECTIDGQLEVRIPSR